MEKKHIHTFEMWKRVICFHLIPILLFSTTSLFGLATTSHEGIAEQSISVFIKQVKQDLHRQVADGQEPKKLLAEEADIEEEIEDERKLKFSTSIFYNTSEFAFLHLYQNEFALKWKRNVYPFFIQQPFYISYSSLKIPF